MNRALSTWQIVGMFMALLGVAFSIVGLTKAYEVRQHLEDAQWKQERLKELQHELEKLQKQQRQQKEEK